MAESYGNLAKEFERFDIEAKYTQNFRFIGIDYNEDYKEAKENLFSLLTNGTEFVNIVDPESIPVKSKLENYFENIENLESEKSEKSKD